MNARLLLAAAVLSSMLAGCPLGRQREVDCGGAVNKAKAVDDKLAPFATVNPAAATDDQVKGWATAATAASESLAGYQGFVHKDVADAFDQYKAAVDGLKDGVGKRAAANDAAASEAVAKARALVQTKRAQLDATCPAAKP